MADRSRVALGLGLGLALAALAISSCGSTSTKTTGATGSGAATSGSVATPAQFIAQASSICKGVRAQDQPLKTRQESLKSLPVTSAETELVSLANQAAAIARAADERLGALARPTADAQTIKQLLQAYSEEASDASSIAKAAAHEESNLGQSAAAALTKSIDLHSAAAKSLGMGDCISGE